MKKRFLALLLACSLVMSVVPFSAFAADEVAGGEVKTVEVKYDASKDAKANGEELYQTVKKADDGATVIIPAGQYELVDNSNNRFTWGKSVTLVGAGESETVITVNSKGIVYDNASGVKNAIMTLKDVTINSGTQGIYAKYNVTVNLENVTIKTGGKMAILLDNANDPYVAGTKTVVNAKNVTIDEGDTVELLALPCTSTNKELVNYAEFNYEDCANISDEVCVPQGSLNLGLDNLFVNGKCINPSVVAVNGKGYASLAKANADAKDGDTITLLSDAELDSSLTVKKKVTLDLNGNTISSKIEDSYGIIYVGMAGDLTITDSSDEGDGAITAENATAVGNYGKVTVEAGTLTAGEEYAALYNFYYNGATYGSAVINGGVFTSPVWNCGVLTVNNGELESFDNSGYVCIVDGTIGDVIFRNGSDAADLENNGTVIISDGMFTGNIVEEDAAVTISGGTFAADPSAYAVDGYTVLKTKAGYVVRELPAELEEIEEFYLFLVEADATDADKVELIEAVYEILTTNGAMDDLDADVIKAVTTVHAVYVKVKDYLDAEETLEILAKIYGYLKDGKMMDSYAIRDVAVCIYNALFEENFEIQLMAAMDYDQKIDILNTIFAELKANGYVEETPELGAAIEVYETVVDKLGDEEASKLFEVAFESMVAQGDEVTVTVSKVTESLQNNPNISDEAKAAIVDKVYEVLTKEEGGLGGAVAVPGLNNPVIKAIYDYLGKMDYITGDQKLAIIDLALKVVNNGDMEVKDLAMDIYGILDENTNLLDKINIAAFIINTLAEEGYLGEASDMVEIAYKYSYMFAFEEGHVDTVADALDVAVDALEEAKDYVEAFETVEELEATKVGLIAALEQAQKTIKVLKEELLKGDPETLGQMLENQYKAYQDLDAVYALAAKLGITEELLLEQANYALDLINDLKAAAYEWAKATKIQIFEEIIEQAAAIDPVLGDAVRAYIYESPEAALAVIYTAGEDAVKVFIDAVKEDISDIEIPDVDLGVVKAEISKLEDTIADIREQIDTLKDYTGEGVDGLIDELEVQLEIAEEYLEKLNNMVEAVETLINELDGDTDVTIDRVKVIVGDVQKMINEAMELADEIADVLDDLADVYEAVMPQLLEVVDGPVKDAFDTSVEEIAQMIEEIEAAYEQTLEILNTASANIESIAVQAAQDVADRVVEAIEDITDATEIAIDEVTTSVETAIAAIKSEAQKLAQSTDDEIRALAEEILDQAEILEQTLQFSEKELKAEHKDLMDIVCTLADTAKNAETISELNALLNDAQDVLDDLKEIAEDVYYIAEDDILYNLPLIKESAHAIRDQAVESGLNIAGAAVEAYNNSVNAILVAADEIYTSVLKAMDAYEVAVTTAVTDIINTVQVAVADVADEVNNAVAATTDVVNVLVSEVLEGAENIVDAWKNALEDGTNGKYVVTTDGYYVAIGDNTAYAEDSYADKLGQYLGIAYDKATLEDEDMIAEADLITVGYDNNDVTDYMLKQVQAAAMGTYEPSDWSAIVGEGGVEYVEVVKSELEAILVNLDLGDTISDYLMAAVEAYAYAYVNQLIENIATVEAIKEINEDALVILVGQYNPLEGVVLTMGEEEIALGDYIQYLVDVVNLESFAYAMLTGDAIYVDAPAVETKSEEAGTALRMPAEEFVGSLFIGGDAMMDMLYPSDAGQIYIKEQILDSLTIYGMLGDADNDGDVDNVDAMLVLQYYTGLADETDLNLFVCDVDGNGAVNNVDAMLILQYYVELITVFPVAEK